MMLSILTLLVAFCVSSPVGKPGEKAEHKHPPVFDGTESTIPKDLKDVSVFDEIEDINAALKKKTGKMKSLFETDIVLSENDKKERGVDTSSTGDVTGADVDVESIGHKRKAIRSRKKIWPSRNIPVEATVDVADARDNVLKAIKEIQDASCVRFRDKEKDDKHWIKFVKKSGCYSVVGREYEVSGAQELSIGSGCNSKGIILHELMHALGFWHEQSRTDRDDYLSVLWENVKPDQTHNFNKYPASEVDFAGGMYDFESLMHYGNYAFSKNKKPTMIALKNPELAFGGNLHLSKTDILQLNAIYDCETPDGGWSSWTDWSPCDRNCTRIRERFCINKNKTKCPGVKADGIQTEKKRCKSDECNVPLNGHWGRWADWSPCSTTCDKGYQTRSRMCDDPPPGFGGDICQGTLVEVQMCKGERPKCKKPGTSHDPLHNARRRTRTKHSGRSGKKTKH